MAVIAVVDADAAHIGHPEEAFLLNAGDDIADVIHMGGKHHLAGIFRLAQLGGDQVAQRVHLDGIDICRDFLPDHIRHGRFQAGGGNGRKQLLQQIKHNYLLLITAH